MKAVIFLSFLLFASVNTSFAQAETTDKIYIAVEQKTEFPGGERALLQFVAKNIKYPVKLRDEGLDCTKLIIQFVIEKDGSISNIKAEWCKEADKTAEEVLETMPRFKPGMQGGKSVRVQYRLPVTFEIEI